MNDSGDKSILPRLRAFTLVEVLAVIFILGLLIIMTVPTINNARRMARLSTCLVTIRVIDSACSLYETDFDALPPCHDGRNPSIEPSAFYHWTGGQILTFLLTGYADDANDPNDPNFPPNMPGKPFYKDDGLDGYGFRLVRGGQKYGPYNETDKIKISRNNYINKNDPNYTRPEFIDTFGNPILYYRPMQKASDDPNMIYRWKADDGFEINPAGPKPDPNDPNEDPNDVVIDLYARNADGAYYRSDFLLISKGAAIEWQAPRNEESLNVTNFKVGAQLK